MSRGCSRGLQRKNSRATRFIRLRWTAKRTFFFAMINPNREWLGLGIDSSRACFELARRSQVSKTVVYSNAHKSRDVRGKA